MRSPGASTIGITAASLLALACWPAKRASPLEASTSSIESDDHGHDPDAGTGDLESEESGDGDGDARDESGDEDGDGDGDRRPPDLGTPGPCAGTSAGACSSPLEYPVDCLGLGHPCAWVQIIEVDGEPEPKFAYDEARLDCILGALASRTPGRYHVNFTGATSSYTHALSTMQGERAQLVYELESGDATTCDWSIHELRPAAFFEDCLTLSFADKVQCLLDWKLDDECVPADENDCILNNCGDGIKDPGEQCDGADLGGWDCLQLGYCGGTMTCADCLFDLSKCESC